MLWQRGRGASCSCRATWEPLQLHSGQPYPFAGTVFTECEASLTQTPLSQNVRLSSHRSAEIYPRT